ncbi:MAG TPA: hypothetical protein VL026_08320 [Rhizomicrobium sp.]|nr:hypothetical protein [Rhizomicrobium sp.]
MNELITAAHLRKSIHWQLLGTACMLALVTAVTAQSASAAPDDTDRPTVWIELGGQLERISGQGQPFTPDFATTYADSPAFEKGTAMQSQKLPRYSKGFEGKLTFVPQGSDWSVSAGLLYGRSNGDRRVHQQTAGIPLKDGQYGQGNPQLDPNPIKAYSDVRNKDGESHLLLDFKATKDVGFGGLGRQSTSQLSFGLRFAQFTTSKNVSMVGRPELNFYGMYGKYWTNFDAKGQAERSFTGLGPSVSWDGSAELTGTQDSGMSFDWGVGAAVLFGRQKARVGHQAYSTEFKKYEFNYNNAVGYRSSPPAAARRRSVVVPNVSGFAGISLHRANAKVSLGYRGDFFFGAMDTGIDRRKTQTMSFHGPFATISIGLGG